ncbi:2-isopropylmalate synthase [Planctomycetota bacterium]|nr:2-isopropylmalate synthase [Planctomycetota bacterium]
MNSRLIIFDTTLRDGEQSPGVSLNVDQKIEIATALDDLGVDVIEAGFPAASEGDFAGVRGISRVVKHASVCALARCHDGDIDTASSAIKQAVKPRLHVFIATSPIHRKHKLRMDRKQVMARANEGIKRALGQVSDVEFSAEDATRTEPEFLCNMAEMAAELGVRTINVPDTVGYSTPSEFAALVGKVHDAIKPYPNTIISVHCHDDLGMSVANSLAGISAGARQVECTINGLGERAGNAALEEVVMAARTRPDSWPITTGIDTTKLVKTSQLVSRLTGFAVPRNKAIVGDNAFAHESGIHQHGVIGNTATYEIMRAADVGAKTSLVFGKHSGRHALEKWLSDNGYGLSDAGVMEVFRTLKTEADRGETLDDSAITRVVKGCMQGATA